MNRWREGISLRKARSKRRRDSMPIELPPRAEEELPRRPVDPAPRLVAPKPPRIPLPQLAARTLLGSLGLALAVGMVVGRMTAGEEPGPAAENEASEFRVRGAGHLEALSGSLVPESAGLLADAEAIREQLLATGIPKSVSVERLLPGAVLIDVEEKRAVAVLGGEPPLALAADGTVLGPATARDFVWTGARDLVLVRGVARLDGDGTGLAALAGRVAEALAARPELDRLVSELDVSGGPFRLRVILRFPPVDVLLTEKDFLAGLERVDGLLLDLLERWPGLSRVDARVPDRLLVRSGPEGAAPGRTAHPERGET